MGGRFVTFGILAALSTYSAAALAVEGPDPVLEIEAGSHSGDVTHLAVSADGLHLAAAADGAVRFFGLPGSRPAGVLRLPRAPGAALHGLALSPDGQLLVAALGPTALGGDSLLLIDRRRGETRRHLALPTVRHAAITPDGAWLLLSLSGGGLRVVSVKDGREWPRSEDDGGPLIGADMDRSGRLLTASQDGFLRLYDARQRVVRRAPVPEGDAPALLRFSADGGQVAVLLSGAVLLLSGQDLHVLKRVELPVSAEGGATLAWAGDALILAGRGGRPAAQLYRTGSGWQDLALPRAATAMTSLPRGGAALSAGAQLGLLSAAGKLALSPPPPLLEAQAGSLQVDATGSRVRFGLRSGEQARALFSAGEHLFSTTAVSDSRFHAARTSLPGLSFAEGRLRLGGAAVPLEEGERATALAVAPEGHAVLLATERALRALRPDGQLLFRAPLPAAARALSFSGDGRLAVVALADGTLRWYSASAGRHLLTLLVHEDRRRWIAWTPAGYYDASGGGEELLGWRVERSGEQPADFFRLGLFHEILYRPDVTARILFTLDERRALEEADAEAGRRPQRFVLRSLLPPVVTILEPKEGALVGTSQVRLRVAVRSPSGAKVTSLRALVRGRFSQGRDLQPGRSGEGEQDLEISVPPENSTVAVVAETDGATGEPALLHLRWEGERPRREVLTRDLHVLAVGVSRYREKRMALDYPAKDAQDLVGALSAQAGKMYRSVDTRVLVDEGASRARVLEGLEWLRRRSAPGDVAVFFLAGHGINNPADGRYYFLPHDADPGAPEGSMVSMTELRAALQRVAGGVLMFLDTCHSGTVMGPQPVRAATDLARLTSELSSVQSGVVVYMASTAGQTSRESQKWKNGAFTKAVVEGLKGRADYEQTGRITVATLAHYVSDRVRELTLEQQTPTTAQPSTVPDFQIAKVWAPYPVQRKWWFWAGVGLLAAGVVGAALAIDQPWQEKSQVFDLTRPAGEGAMMGALRWP